MKKLFIIIVFIFISVLDTYAQYGSTGSTDARSMGMGNTYNAVSRGLFSIGINPANLLNDDNLISFSTVFPIPSLSIKSGTNIISLNDLNYFFGGVNGQARQLNDNDKQRLNSLFENGGLILGNLSVNIFSLELNFGKSTGAFAFSVNDVIAGNINVPRALSEMVFSGNPAGSNYNFNETRINSWWIRNYSASYAREMSGFLKSTFEKLEAGISFKYVQGFEFVQSSRTTGNFINTNSGGDVSLSTNYTIQSSFSDNFGVKYSFDSAGGKEAGLSPFPAPAGNGFGFDIGFNAIVNEYLNFSLAITDIGSIHWNQNTALTYSIGQYTINNFTDQSAQDSVKDIFKGNSKSISGFTVSLPTALRIGAAYRLFFNRSGFPGNLLVAVDINKGFNEQPGNSLGTRISFGTEWKPMDWIPYLRSGVSFGGLLGFHWAIGLGIDAGLLEFNLSTQDFQSVAAPGSAKYISLAFNSMWKF